MTELFIAMVLGHMVADYLLQTKKMSIAKSAPGVTGHLWCTWHCAIYTSVVCAFTGLWSPLTMMLVFLSHWPIDRWSLAAVWLKLIGGRGILKSHASISKHRNIEVSFACLVYAAADNTMHIVLLWMIARLL